MKHCLNIICVFLFFSISQVSLAQCLSESHVVADHLDIPWSMDWLDDETIIFTQLSGELLSVNITHGSIRELYKFDPIAREIQGGLMGISVHTNFESTPTVFVVYSYFDGTFQPYTRVSSFSYNQDEHKLENETILLDSIRCSSSNLGGRIVHHPDNFLFITIGDMDRGQIAQRTDILNGKVLRINDDGSIPNDNPIPNSPIWTIGHRNPQGIAISPEGIFISEHGSFIDDEINRLVKGENYGWPITSGIDSNFISPVHVWNTTVAPGSLRYCSDCFDQQQSRLILTTLKTQQLYSFHISPEGELSEQQLLVNGEFGRIRDVLISPNKDIYICTSNKDIYGKPSVDDDKIIRLKFHPCD